VYTKNDHGGLLLLAAAHSVKLWALAARAFRS